MTHRFRIECVVSVMLVRAAAGNTGAELSLLTSRFEEPLVTTGATSPGENAALLAAVRA